MADINVEQYLPRFPQQPLQQIWGLVPKYNDATSIDVLPGACMDDTDSVRIDWTLTKNKVLSGAVADTIYNIFAIKNPGTGATDVHLDTSLVSPTLPSGFTFKRWLGWCRTDGDAEIIPADYMGNGIGTVEMWFKARQTVATGLGQGAYTEQTLSEWIPAGVECNALFGGIASSGGTTAGDAYLSSDGVNLKAAFQYRQTNSGVGQTHELANLGSHPSNFVPIVGNQIYYKRTNVTLTLLLRAIRYWR